MDTSQFRWARSSTQPFWSSNPCWSCPGPKMHSYGSATKHTSMRCRSEPRGKYSRSEGVEISRVGSSSSLSLRYRSAENGSSHRRGIRPAKNLRSVRQPRLNNSLRSSHRPRQQCSRQFFEPSIACGPHADPITPPSLDANGFPLQRPCNGLCGWVNSSRRGGFGHYVIFRSALRYLA